MTAVFHLLNRHGYSQRRIAALTDLNQSEVSEIVRRRGKARVVMSVDLLERIADGLGTPRGWWRLAGHSDDATEEVARALEVARHAEAQRHAAVANRQQATELVSQLRATVASAADLLAALEATVTTTT